MRSAIHRSSDVPTEEAAGCRTPWPWWYAIAALVFAHAMARAVLLPAWIVRIPGPVATLVLDGCFVATAILFGRRVGRSLRRDLGLRAMTITPRRALGRVIVARVGAAVLIGIYMALLPAQLPPTVWDYRPSGVVASVAMALTGVLTAPVSEEVFYRGLLYRAVRNHTGPATAIAINSAVFGLMHWVGGDPFWSVMPRVIYGVFFCLLYERSGSLYPGIAMHIWLDCAIAVWVYPVLAPFHVAALLLAALVAVVRSGGDARRRPARGRPGLRRTPEPRVPARVDTVPYIPRGV